MWEIGLSVGYTDSSTDESPTDTERPGVLRDYSGTERKDGRDGKRGKK